MCKVEKQLFFMAALIMVVLYLCFAIASYFNIKIYLESFGYISFALSLIALVLSMFDKLKRYAQKNKSYVYVA